MTTCFDNPDEPQPEAAEASAPGRPQSRGPGISEATIRRTMQKENLSAYGISINAEADNIRNPPCYLPQLGEDMPIRENLKSAAPAAWGSGKIDWSPMAKLTLTRPIPDRYSITRYSPNEWRARNQEVVKNVNIVFDKANKNVYSSKTTVSRIKTLLDTTQGNTKASLRARVQLVGKWKKNLEDAIGAMADEITIMEEQRLRLKQSLVIFGVPESIAKECIQHRSGRTETELVRDNVEEELVREVTLIDEVRQLLRKTLEDFEAQQVDNRAARERLEFDWSDKMVAYDIDTLNVGLNNKSPTIMFRPGSVRQPAEQASEKYWEHFSMDTLTDCEKCRIRSIKLRHTLNSILLNGAKDIRNQADVVEKALMARINCTQENVQRFENDLKECLSKLAKTEHRIEHLHRTLRTFDASMKVAQTRMDNRNHRQNVENCRDSVQKDLIDEVSTIQSGVSSMLMELEQAENVKKDLMDTRRTLEHEIMLKRRSLWIDRDRCMLLRSHYPSANAMSGYTSL